MSSIPRRADLPFAFALLSRRRLRGSIAPAAVDALASAIQTQEGWYPGSVSYRNNNPGNLVFAGQAGASPGVGGFASFASYSLGDAALKNQITLDAVRGSDAAGRPINSISDLINSWAPASDPSNDPASYIASVVAQTGYDPNAPLSSLGASSGSVAAPVYSLPDASALDSSGDTGGLDLSGSVDLSSVGLPSATPYWAIAAGVLGLFFLASR